MIRWIVSLAPALAAALLGFVAQRAESPESYVQRLRVLIAGSLVLAWIAVAIYVWRRQEGAFRRSLLLLLMLATLRILYVPLVEIALVGAAWIERFGARAGLADRSVFAHASFGFLVAGLAGPFCMLVVAAVTRPLRWLTSIGLLLLVLFGVAAFLAPGDRRIVPQDLGSRVEERPAPASAGADFSEVLLRRGERISTRVVAAAGFLLHSAMPRAGWGGAVRDGIERRYRAEPNESWTDALADLEQAFLESRPALRGAG